MSSHYELVESIEKEFLNDMSKPKKFSNTGMICMNCCKTINSKYHYDNCMTVNMFETQDEILDDNFKNMMTYGLGGCTAGFVVYKENDTIRVWMSHHPDSMIFKLSLFKLLLKNKDNIIRVVVRGNGSYVKNQHNEYFHDEMDDNDKYMEMLEMFSCAYSLEPYFPLNHESTFICVKYKDGNLFYTDTLGNFEKISL